MPQIDVNGVQPLGLNQKLELGQWSRRLDVYDQRELRAVARC